MAKINRPVTAIPATITTFKVDDELLDGDELLLPEEPGDLFDGASREGEGGGNAFSAEVRGEFGKTGAGGENIDDEGELGFIEGLALSLVELNEIGYGVL
ncbi:hypothetical protein HAX54_018610 [Datura stramonium]|uniref:Uncharacterized protein n=1 Tax=Datura stramonium TaxID=4076 RepID=A0ABS8UPV1_DATST|nr:hypothetical protein [Datura stramonium]